MRSSYLEFNRAHNCLAWVLMMRKMRKMGMDLFVLQPLVEPNSLDCLPRSS